MLSVPRYSQKPSYCGPSVLRMVAAYFGVRVSEEKLGTLCRTTLEQGTTHADMVRAARALGFHVEEREHGTRDDLVRLVNEEKIPVIVGWFKVDEGHYSVVVNVTPKQVWIIDPYDAKTYRKSHQRFHSTWFDFRHGGVIERHLSPDEQVCLGWYLVLRPKKKKRR